MRIGVGVTGMAAGVGVRRAGLELVGAGATPMPTIRAPIITRRLTTRVRPVAGRACACGATGIGCTGARGAAGDKRPARRHGLFDLDRIYGGAISTRARQRSGRRLPRPRPLPATQGGYGPCNLAAPRNFGSTS